MHDDLVVLLGLVGGCAVVFWVLNRGMEWLSQSPPTTPPRSDTPAPSAAQALVPTTATRPIPAQSGTPAAAVPTAAQPAPQKRDIFDGLQMGICPVCSSLVSGPGSIQLVNGHRCHDKCARSVLGGGVRQALYDYWPTYPPDWRFRWQDVALDRRRCADCQREFEDMNWRGWDVHHVVPISQGGSHKSENLELLCNECHSEAHGGRPFSDNKWDGAQRAPSSFARHLDRINEAIRDGKCLRIEYRAFGGDRTSRTIRPIAIQHPEFEGTTGSRLAVRAYCYLRNDEREFVIDRIKSLRVVATPKRPRRSRSRDDDDD